jgi:hypothetical protein
VIYRTDIACLCAVRKTTGVVDWGRYVVSVRDDPAASLSISANLFQSQRTIK